MSAQKFKVGQELWFVSYSGRDSTSIKVLKVGRRYLQVERDGVVDSETMTLKRGARALGKCYLTKEAHDAEVEAEKLSFKVGVAWKGIRTEMPYLPPKTVTLEDIAQARKLLGLEPKP